MGKYDTDEVGKPGKPLRPRPFPWKLWLFALVMAAAAGAAGYFAWDFREQVKATEVSQAEHAGKLASTEKAAVECKAAQDQHLKVAADAKAIAAKCVVDSKDLTAQNTKLSGNLNASKDELAALRVQQREIENRLAAIAEIQKQFARMIDTGAMKVTARRGSLVISLPAEVLFPSAVADLSEDGLIKVQEVGFTLKKFPDRRYLVVGHSDNQPLKSALFKDNWELATARALTVTRVLVKAGMDPKNLVPAGAGEHDPLIEKATSAKDLARNRRIEIALLPAINELPPLPAGLGETPPADGGKAPPESKQP
ncbi:MAG: OmpA family protein [Kofleriaceae bacterium]